MKTIKRLPRSAAHSKLERHVLRWLNERAKTRLSGIRGVASEVIHNGCRSEVVAHLNTLDETRAFFNAHKGDINALFADALIDVAGPEYLKRACWWAWDVDDPLALDRCNQNLLAWFAFEEAARRICERAGVEV